MYTCTPVHTLTFSTENATSPKPTRSEQLDSSVFRVTTSNSDFGFIEFVLRNLSFSIWWISGVLRVQWNLSYVTDSLPDILLLECIYVYVIDSSILNLYRNLSCFDLVDFGGVACSVESIIYMTDSLPDIPLSECMYVYMIDSSIFPFRNVCMYT